MKPRIRIYFPVAKENRVPVAHFVYLAALDEEGKETIPFQIVVQRVPRAASKTLDKG